ncbi:ParB family chromosome partitioning protein [Hydrogenoanaerobacterium saccharovorans]|uniref:Chromosome partitioning protein, ParB family n=1 Tax=Hydrogenoanaerobacterium saccharovorans TaxID=474960 RepID=A0A1H8CI06_9FIRM|nr:ParB/RepB/Spo0J family partition protein [Hydrogenoanaerobacterium saccharovorans]RPF43128.1 ParB family chromosome partitioning protein [Hydrogenoanaerobacterium saccharovorans]SEM94723.1 chromosome partitioning protein, ParB family [Hydrogenoanaerobacterium saccharovorans]
MAGRKGGLGKGLDALFVDNNTTSTNVLTLRISEIEPNKGQPRRDFDEAALADLADSIREHGVIQPLLVRPMPAGTYQLIAGERRWRAARMAGLSEVPVVIRELDDMETMEIALIENLQREDLNAIEESLGYKALADQYNMTQEQIAKSVGKSRPVIANALRLLNLPQKVIEMVRRDELSVGHARAMLALESKKEIVEMAERIVKQHLTVRDVERLVNAQKLSKQASEQKAKPLIRDTFYEELELAATQEIGRKVKIKQKKDKGKLEIEFFSKQDLSDIMEKLTGEKLSW